MKRGDTVKIVNKTLANNKVTNIYGDVATVSRIGKIFIWVQFPNEQTEFPFLKKELKVIKL